MVLPVGRARINARGLGLKLGDVPATLERVSVDILSDRPDGAVDLENRNPRLQMQAARVVISGQEVATIARENARKAGFDLNLKLGSPEEFRVSGLAPGGVPFQGVGQIGANQGKLAFRPARVELSDKGMQIVVDLSARRGKVIVPDRNLLEALSGALDSPTLHSKKPNSFELSALLNLNGEKVPLSVPVQISTLPDGKLRFRPGSLLLGFKEARVRVDLATKKATAQVPLEVVHEAFRTVAKDLHEPRLTILPGSQVVVEGTVDSTSESPGSAGLNLGKLRFKLQTAVDASAGKVRAAVSTVELRGEGIEIDAQLQTATASVRLAADTVERQLKAQHFGSLSITGFKWTGPRSWQMAGDFSGTRLLATGSVRIPGNGKVVFDLASLDLEEGEGKISLQLDPARNAILAAIPAAVLTRMVAKSTPLEGLDIKIRDHEILETSLRFSIWKIAVPVRLWGKLALSEDRKPQYEVSRANVFGVPLLGLATLFGLTLKDLGAQGEWRGNTLALAPALPTGMRLDDLKTRPGVLLATLVGGEDLSGAPGIRFDGKALEIDPAILAGVPGTVTALGANSTHVELTLRLDHKKVAQLVGSQSGVTYEKGTFFADPQQLAGKPFGGRLDKVAFTESGMVANLTLNDEVLNGLQHLPPGVKFVGGAFEIDPKVGQKFPGKIVSAQLAREGLVLGLAFSQRELREVFVPDAHGVAWDGRELTLDPVAMAPPGVAAKATGAHVRQGDLVVDMGGPQGPSGPTGDRVLLLETQGSVVIEGIRIEQPRLQLKPKADQLRWDLENLRQSDVRLESGRLIVPKSKLLEVVRQALSPEEYRRLRPRYERGRLVVSLDLAIFRVPLALRFDKTSRGHLLLAPSGLWGQLPLVEWPQRLIGLLLTPVTWLIPGAKGLEVDLAAKSGVGLPPLQGVEARESELVLDFVADPQTSDAPESPPPKD